MLCALQRAADGYKPEILHLPTSPRTGISLQAFSSLTGAHSSVSDIYHKVN